VALPLQPATWHYGLIARWWAEFNRAEPEELGFWRSAVRRFGEPALDLGCGSGRLLIPLRGEGLDVDGCDVSPDMIEFSRRELLNRHLPTGRLHVQPMHELNTPRRYRTILICGAFGLGSTREQDRESLRRAYRHLKPGGALVIDLCLPYMNIGWWNAYPAQQREQLPRPYPDWGEPKTAANGEQLNLRARLAAIDPLDQRITLEIEARLYRDGAVVQEEHHHLTENEYFKNELALLLELARFTDIEIVKGNTDRPPMPDDAYVALIGRKPG